MQPVRQLRQRSSDQLHRCLGVRFDGSTFTYGNFGRNVLFGPGLYNVDFSVFKNFRIRERASVQFRAEFFNLFNTPAFSNPMRPSRPPTPRQLSSHEQHTFGNITSTKHDNRQIQFALKFLF